MSTNIGIVKSIKGFLRMPGHIAVVRTLLGDIPVDKLRTFAGERVLQYHAAKLRRWFTLESHERLEVQRDGIVVAIYPGYWFTESPLPAKPDQQEEGIL